MTFIRELLVSNLWRSYPNWDINYAGRETDFVEMIWTDFRRSFDFDGLQCMIFSESEMTNDQKLIAATELIMDVWENLVPDRPPESIAEIEAFEEISAIAERISSGIDQLRELA